MKKIFLCLAVMFSAVFVAAEDMKFVTLLSQPVGSFSRVELLDQSTPADIFHLNFCNTDASGGNITVSSSLTTPVNVEKLVVDSGATLGGNLSYVLADKITVYNNSGFVGGSLSAQLSGPAKILVDDKRSQAAEFIHENSVLIKTADFNTLNIYDKAVLDTPASGSTLATDLSWKEVDSSNTDKAYILTNIEDAVCGGKVCDDGFYLNKATCLCVQLFPGIGVGPVTPVDPVTPGLEQDGSWSCSRPATSCTASRCASSVVPGGSCKIGQSCCHSTGMLCSCSSKSPGGTIVIDPGNNFLPLN